MRPGRPPVGTRGSLSPPTPQVGNSPRDVQGSPALGLRGSAHGPLPGPPSLPLEAQLGRSWRAVPAQVTFPGLSLLYLPPGLQGGSSRCEIWGPHGDRGSAALGTNGWGLNLGAQL